MFHAKISPGANVRAIPTGELALRAFFSEQDEPLGDVAVLLSGRRSARLVNAIRDGLDQPGRITRRVQRRLLELRRILFLDHVKDDDWDDMDGAAMLDPTIPASLRSASSRMVWTKLCAAPGSSPSCTSDRTDGRLSPPFRPRSCCRERSRKGGMAPHANADLRLAGNSSAATGTPVGEQRTRNRKERIEVLEAAVTKDGTTRSIDMLHKMDAARVDNPRARVIVVKEFFDANGETLLGAVATIGGPRAHLGCLQLMCDISSCAQ